MKLQTKVKGYALMGMLPSPKLPHGTPLAVAALSVPMYGSGGQMLDLAALTAEAAAEAEAAAMLLVRPARGVTVTNARMPIINDALRVSNADLSPAQAAAFAMLEDFDNG